MFIRILIFLILLLSLHSCKEANKPAPIKEKSVNIPTASTPSPKQELTQLLRNISSGQSQKALEYLNGQLPRSSANTFSELSIFKNLKLNGTFTESPKFTEVDFYYLFQAATFKKEAFKILSNKNDDPIKLCYQRVREKIKGKFPQKDTSAFPLDIWQRGYGVCDRQSWVMCELAYQLGAEVFVIYLIDDKTGISPHTICEIIYKNKTYLVDPLYGKFLENTHLRDLPAKTIKETWPQHPEIYNCFDKATIQVPVMPHDYTKRHFLLGQVLAKQLGKNVIRIGENPQQRALKWPLQKGDDLRYWEYPFRLLKTMKLYKKLPAHE